MLKCLATGRKALCALIVSAVRSAPSKRMNQGCACEARGGCAKQPEYLTIAVHQGTILDVSRTGDAAGASMSHRSTLRFVPQGRVIWAQLFALFALVFATSAPQQIAKQVASTVHEDSGDHGDDCTDDCNDCDGPDSCPGPCADCACCAAPNALPSNRVALLGAPYATEAVFSSPEDAFASGYSSLPFRPPTV